VKYASATAIARNFGKFLSRVERGQTMQITKRGKIVARLVPDCDFMDGKRAAALLAGHISDPETADAIAKQLARVGLWAECEPHLQAGMLTLQKASRPPKIVP